MTPELSAKQLELLREIVPTMSRVGIARCVWIFESWTHGARRNSRPPSPRYGETARATVLVLAHPTFFAHRKRLVEAASESRLPVLYGTAEHVRAGGLMAYAASVVESYRRGAVFVDRILKGARPADLPVEQPTKFELVINLRTAKALGSPSRHRCSCGRTRSSNDRPAGLRRRRGQRPHRDARQRHAAGGAGLPDRHPPPVHPRECRPARSPKRSRLQQPEPAGSDPPQPSRLLRRPLPSRPATLRASPRRSSGDTFSLCAVTSDLPCLPAESVQAPGNTAHRTDDISVEPRAPA